MNCPEEVACPEVDLGRRALGGLAHGLDVVGWQGDTGLLPGSSLIMYIVAQVKHQCLPLSKEPFRGDQAYALAHLFSNLLKWELACLRSCRLFLTRLLSAAMDIVELLILGR